MSKLPYFPFYPKDFLVDTIQLSEEQVGAYMRLLCVLWENGRVKWQPHSDRNPIASISQSAAEVVELLKDKFTFHPDGTITNNRLEEVRAQVADKQAKKSRAGKKGAAARWKIPAKKNSKRKSKRNGIANNKRIAEAMPYIFDFDFISVFEYERERYQERERIYDEKHLKNVIGPKQFDAIIEIYKKEPDLFELDQLALCHLISWLEYKKKKKQSLGDQGVKAFIKDLHEFSDSILTAAIFKAIQSGWAGCFPEKIKDHGRSKTKTIPARGQDFGDL